MTPNGDLIRSGEAARMLGISRSTLDRWVKAGKVRYFELSPYGERRFDPKDIRALLREGKAKAEPPSEGQEG